MKLFCWCNEPWIDKMNGCKFFALTHHKSVYTRQIESDQLCIHADCDTGYYWYNADYENMMFDLRRMNQC